jgi:hypothetical protein
MIPGDLVTMTWRSPAGPGKLAVLDAAAPGAPRAIALGGGAPPDPACGNANGLALSGTTLWVTCAWGGSHAIVPVDVSGAPAAGAAVDLSAASAAGPFTPAAIAFCGGMGYVGDLWSGRVARIRADGAPIDAADACPTGSWSSVADLACPE